MNAIPVIGGALLLGLSVVVADWPNDDEEFGILGCKFFKFKGYWEQVIDTVEPDESIEGACLTVALAGLINYHRWPKRNRFDGEYFDCAGMVLPKPIEEEWAFDLITGNKKNNEDCSGDDPELRSAPDDPERTGLSEIRRLLYAVERSFGYHHECFRTTEEECGGTGYIPVQHVLRNRFGYPLSTALAAGSPEGKKKAIENILSGYPIIALKCDHAYIVDGYKIDKSSGKRLFHVCDYVMSEHSTGWFTWKELLSEGLFRVVVDIKPTILLRRGPSAQTVRYEWGNGRLPLSRQSRKIEDQKSKIKQIVSLSDK